MKIALIASLATIAVALLGGAWHSEVYADDPVSVTSRASRSPADASQALRRYTLSMLHILSDENAANKWARYWQAKAHCDIPPTPLTRTSSTSGSDVSRLDAALAALNDQLCGGGLERRLDVNLDDYPPLDENRTVGLLLNEPEAMHGYTLIPGRYNNYVHLIDHLGRVVNEWRFGSLVLEARLLDNGNLLVHPEVRSIAEVDPDGNIVWQYKHTDNFHHDFLKMPNGNVLMLVDGVKTREEAIAAGVNPNIVPAGGLVYDYLIEVRPTGSEGGEIVWEWSAWDYIVQDFDPTKENYGEPAEHPELIDINSQETPQTRHRIDALNWLHTNAIDYNPALDQIMLSPRNHNELWIIDRSATAEEAPTRKGGNAGRGGALLYRWGNPRAYGHGTAADRRLFLQHHTQWIDPELPGAGNILVFNNGWAYEEDQSRNYSSIEEIVPPLDGYGYRREPGAAYPPTDPVWTYTAETPTDFYSRIMGGVQRLPNGNTLIYESTSGNLFQVTPDGKTVWQYVYPMDENTPLKQGDALSGNAVYRAYWYAPDHPGLQKYDLTPGATIELYE